MKQWKSHKGYGLLEILLTLVLLGVGVAGLVAFSRGLLGVSQDGKRYEVAMRLAESKLDELRNFNGIVTAVSPLRAYQGISAGSGNQTVSGDTYSLSWAVSNQFWGGSGWVTSQPAGYLFSYPARKVVTVTVSWSDNQGQSKSLQLSGAITPVDTLSASQLNNGLDTTRPKPKVSYTPGVVPDVVSVDLGNGSKKETSKPLPHIKGNTGSSRLIQFDSITYQTQGTASNKQSLQDTATVYCSCSTTGNFEKAYLPDTPYYSANDRVQYWKTGELVDKGVGVLQGNSNQQETLCPSCCREHYDVADKGFFGYYAPLNISRGKYRMSGASLQSVSSGDYIDACRFIRIDGVYRPAPDWRLVSLTTFSAAFLNDATNLANYQAYIAYVITEHAKWQQSAFASKSDSNWSAVSSSPSIQSFNTWLAGNRGGSSTDLSTPIGTLQLISRGIYVDIMSPGYLSNEVFQGGASEPNIAKIPFQDVNMTLLSEWSSGDSNKATVTSQPIATVVDPTNNYYGTYSRGLLSAKNTTFSGTPQTDTPITITARSYQGNSGIVGAPVLQQDIDAQVSSTMRVSILASAVANLHGVVECLQLKTTGNANNPNHSAVSCDATSVGLTVGVNNMNVTCSLLDMGKPAKPNYTCSGVPSSSFTLTLSKSGYRVTPSSQSLTLPSSGSTTSGCVMMVEEALLAVLPATPTTCSSQP
ncbi:hypothetical protein [Aeromonas simiae]|uniref:hypothetical protein n=1 Tax=Aeromonas simiae TaxID=218936 RepID=UPI0005A69FAD|nr:hypothetical protein [Aeromonas simiae]